MWAKYENPTDPKDFYIRHILFPPFREAEIYMGIKNKTFTEKKKFYLDLEKLIVD